MYIKKSLLIQKEVKSIFNYLNDFHNWPQWSPWLIADPNTSLNIDTDGKYYIWEGDVTGSGDMRVLSETKNKSLSCSLNFYKPWKSKVEVDFYLEEKSDGTKVAWTMKSSLPWFLFWMKKSMEVYVGMDYERGLLLLKDLVEQGNTLCDLKFEGYKNSNKTKYIGFETRCKMSNIEQIMTEDFENVVPKLVHEYQDLICGNPFTLYHKFDPVKDKIVYTIGLPIKEAIHDLPTPYFVKELPDIKVRRVLLTGPYRHLGTAWATQVMHQRAKKFKSKKGLVPFEVYLNKPQDTEEKELKTAVFNPPYLRNPNGKYKGYPFRNEIQGTQLEGYSDHFPVYVVLGKGIE